MSQRNLCIAVMALAVFAAGAPIAYAEDATVPCVVGLPLDKAEALLAQAGFTAAVQRVQGKPIGIVASQEPGGLATRAKGSAVRLIVGGAPPKFEPPSLPPTHRPPTGPPPADTPPAGAPPVGPDIGMPPTGAPPGNPLGGRPTPRQPEPRVPDRPLDPGLPPASAPLTVDGRPMPEEPALNRNGPELPTVLGQPVNQARGALRGWRVGVEYTLAVPELVGKVVNQWPHGGARLASGQGVVIVVAVAEPPSAEHTGVPQVERHEWRAAMASLTAAGFSPVPTSVPSLNAERGRVISQQPLPGSLAPRGSTVRIRVGRGIGAADRPYQPPAVPDARPPAVAPPVVPPTQPPVQPPVRPPATPAPGALPAPMLRTPASGEAYPHRYGASFSWAAVSGAAAYEWELEEELPSGAWQKVGSRMVSGAKFRPDELKRGRFRWRVRAVHAATKGAWSQYRRLYMY